MKKIILICLCHTALLAALCLAAEARMIIGVTPGAALTSTPPAAFDRLGEELGLVAGTPVTVRRFEDEATLSNWLLRFQEIDAAIVAPGFITQQPAGALLHLVDLHGVSNASGPWALVSRNNLGNSQIAQIKEAFLKVGLQDRGRKVLREVGLAGITPPGERLKQTAVQPKPPQVEPPAEKTPPPAAPKLEVAPLPDKQAAPPTKQRPQSEEQAAKPAVTEPPAKPAVTEPSAKTTDQAESTKETAKTAEKPAETAANQQPPATVAGKTEEAGQTIAAKERPDTAPPGKTVPHGEPVRIKSSTDKRLIVFVVLIILIAILIKLCLLALRWKKKKAAHRSGEAPIVLHWNNNKPQASSAKHDAPDLAVPGPPAAPAATSKAAAAATEPLVIETGRLGQGKVPALLKRCADLPEPVVLQVTKGSSEKLVYFAGGQVSGALTQNTQGAESGLRWNKLGNLLVREELITSEQRDQGLARVVSEPTLRFGEALLKLGLIDLAGLRHALTRQAKVTIYSLILFPEGHYQVFAGDGSLPPEESVSLEVTNLIREASHHQSEWTAIRQAIPKLSKALDFTADGRDKLTKVSLSPQQEAILDLIDGKRTINDLCIESTMMDYEVYRFLYLMVKAGVLT